MVDFGYHFIFNNTYALSSKSSFGLSHLSFGFVYCLDWYLLFKYSLSYSKDGSQVDQFLLYNFIFRNGRFNGQPNEFCSNLLEFTRRSI